MVVVENFMYYQGFFKVF